MLLIHPCGLRPGYCILVGGLEHFLWFHILGIIIPTDEVIFFRGVGIPPTSIHQSPQFFLLPYRWAGLAGLANATNRGAKKLLSGVIVQALTRLTKHLKSVSFHMYHDQKLDYPYWRMFIPLLMWFYVPWCWDVHKPLLFPWNLTIIGSSWLFPLNVP